MLAKETRASDSLARFLFSRLLLLLGLFVFAGATRQFFPENAPDDLEVKGFPYGKSDFSKREPPGTAAQIRFGINNNPRRGGVGT